MLPIFDNMILIIFQIQFQIKLNKGKKFISINLQLFTKSPVMATYLLDKNKNMFDTRPKENLFVLN